MAVNIIFIHGVNSQKTGYSNILYKNIIKDYIGKLLDKGLSETEANGRAYSLAQKEILWADATTDLTNRYLFLQYHLSKKSGKWNFFIKEIDPLMMQILHYVKDKGHKKGPMTILKDVHESFKAACPNKKDNAVVIAHSLGSVIAYDYLCRFRKFYLDPAIRVEAFITLGSPIPLFASAMGFVENKFKWPSNVRSWVNILDPDDGVARICAPFFKNVEVEDMQVNTGFGPLSAHSGYWKSREVSEIIAQKLVSLKL